MSTRSRCLGSPAPPEERPVPENKPTTLGGQWSKPARLPQTDPRRKRDSHVQIHRSADRSLRGSHHSSPGPRITSQLAATRIAPSPTTMLVNRHTSSLNMTYSRVASANPFCRNCQSPPGDTAARSPIAIANTYAATSTSRSNLPVRGR